MRMGISAIAIIAIIAIVGRRATMRHAASFRSVSLAFMLCVAIALLSACAGGNMSGTQQSPGTPTTQDALTSRLQHAVGTRATRVTLTYDAVQQSIETTVTVGGPVARTSTEINASQERVKALCFQAQQALWTSGVALREVKVTILGPVYDDYYDLVTEWYGGADLKAATAQQFNWRTLDADSAWSRYDVVWLRVDYGSFQQYGAPTPIP